MPEGEERPGSGERDQLGEEGKGFQREKIRVSRVARR